MNTGKIILGGIVIVAVLAILSVSGCANVNTKQDHRQDNATYDAAADIDLDVSTFNGNVGVQPSSDGKVHVIYNVSAVSGHLADVVTGTNSSRNGDTLKLDAEAKLANPTRDIVYDHGADIVVNVPANATFNMTLTTSNGNVVVPLLIGNRMTIDTSNGNIDIAAGNYTTIGATTSNGNIGVKLQNGTPLTLSMTTSNGHVRHGSIAMQSDHSTETSFVGYTAETGSLHMVLQTSNGNIDVDYV